jgi:hypothetical protein
MVKKTKQKNKAKKRNVLYVEMKDAELLRRIQRNIKIIEVDYKFRYQIIPQILDVALEDFIKRNKKDM